MSPIPAHRVGVDTLLGGGAAAEQGESSAWFGGSARIQRRALATGVVTKNTCAQLLFAATAPTVTCRDTENMVTLRFT
jgi:hypothetical protein